MENGARVFGVARLSIGGQGSGTECLPRYSFQKPIELEGEMLANLALVLIAFALLVAVVWLNAQS